MSSTPSPRISHLDKKEALILWGAIDPRATDEIALNDWWTNEHLPERLHLPGFHRARLYRALESSKGAGEYLAWYEASDIRDLASKEYLEALTYR